jgi:hypothetical protein
VENCTVTSPSTKLFSRKTTCHESRSDKKMEENVSVIHWGREQIVGAPAPPIPPHLKR